MNSELSHNQQFVDVCRKNGAVFLELDEHCHKWVLYFELFDGTFLGIDFNNMDPDVWKNMDGFTCMRFGIADERPDLTQTVQNALINTFFPFTDIQIISIMMTESDLEGAFRTLENFWTLRKI